MYKKDKHQEYTGRHRKQAITCSNFQCNIIYKNIELLYLKHSIVNNHTSIKKKKGIKGPTLCTVGGKEGSCWGWNFLKKLKIELSYDLGIPLLGLSKCTPGPLQHYSQQPWYRNHLSAPLRDARRCVSAHRGILLCHEKTAVLWMDLSTRCWAKSEKDRQHMTSLTRAIERPNTKLTDRTDWVKAS